MWGVDSFGDIAWGDTSADNSQPSKLLQLLDDSDAKRIHLMIATPYDPGASAETTIRLSDVGFKTKPADSPANTLFEPRLTNPFNFEVSLFRGGQVLGGGSASFGAIQIRNEDGELDSLTDLLWDGRSVEIRVGTDSFEFSEFETVYQGRAEDISWDDRMITVQLRDPRTRIDQNIQPTLYAGTGGDEGDASLAGRPKPLCYGECREVKAVLIDSVNLIYQVHDGSIEDITDVYDAGASLTDEGDVADLRAAAAPSAGAFKTDLADGLFRLGATPDGTITADVQGDNNGSYVTTATDIMRRIAVDQGGLDANTDLDGASFNNAAIDSPDTVGLFIPDAPRPLPSVFDEIMAAVGGWWTFDRAGLLKVGILQVPGSPVLTLKAHDIIGGTIRRTNPRRVAWRIRLGYDRTFTVQSEGSLAAALSAAEKALRSNEYRFVSAEDSAIQTKHSLAQEIERVSLFVGESAAQTEVDRLLNLLGERRDLYEIPVGWRLFKFDIDDSVTLDLDRFDLPKTLRIIGIAENVKRREATLIGWG